MNAHCNSYNYTEVATKAPQALLVMPGIQLDARLGSKGAKSTKTCLLSLPLDVQCWPLGSFCLHGCSW